MYRVAILGYGGIGHVHAGSYYELEQAGKAKLVSVFDKYPASFSEKTAINTSSDTQPKPVFHAYTDLEEMLSKERIDVIDICLPTNLHKDCAVSMLSRGYHVMCEKPMATSYEDCHEMRKAAEQAGKCLMIGHCLRFFSEYEYLKDAVTDGRFGAVRSAFFERLSAPPIWCKEGWNLKKENFGGCLYDMHIHDVDMAYYLFGEPKNMICQAKDGYGRMDRVTSLLAYDDHLVTLVADWSLPNFPFRAAYRVSFEKATVVCQSGSVKVYPDEGEPFEPVLDRTNGYTKELAYFLDAVAGNNRMEKNRVSDSAETVRLILSLAACAENE